MVLTLRKMILRGNFRPGERIAEIAVAARLKASRTPVRLALDRLAHEALLEPQPTGGFRVREFAVADIWDAIEIRGVLEGTAARLAAERRTDPGDLALLRQCCEEQERALPTELQEFVRYFELNDAFHRGLWRLAKSPILERTMETVIALPFAAPSALLFSPSDARERRNAALVAIDQHRSIVDAIEHQEGTRAESLAREHTRIARRNLMDALQNSELFRRMPGASLVRMPAPREANRA